jgi:hypothetical protein
MATKLTRLQALEEVVQPASGPELVVCLVVKRDLWEALGDGEEVAPPLVMRPSSNPDDLVILAPRRR